MFACRSEESVARLKRFLLGFSVWQCELTVSIAQKNRNGIRMFVHRRLFMRAIMDPQNPDFGGTFGQAINIVDRPAIPVQNQTLYTSSQIQAIANTASFHFAMIEQGGSSLYEALSFKCSSLLALRIVGGIGGSEVVCAEPDDGYLQS